jgi:hypothetical protein
MAKKKNKSKDVNKKINLPKIRIPAFKLPKIRFSKKLWVILGVVLFIVLGLVGGGTYYLYNNPYKSIEIKKNDSRISYKKVPIFNSKIIVERDDEEIFKKELPAFSISNTEEVDFSEDGFYKVTYVVASENWSDEFEIDRTPPEISEEYKAITNQEEEEILVSINEEGITSISFTKIKVDDESGEKTQQEVTKEITEGKVKVSLTEGENEFNLMARDEWDNETSKEVKILADFTDPKIEYLQPKYSETYRASETIKVKVTDKNLKTVKINGEEIEGKDDVYSKDVSWGWGEHGITIEAVDEANNKSVFKHSVIRKANAVERVEVIDGSGGSDGGSNDGGDDYTPPPPEPACSNTLSGYNVFCWLNEERKSAGLSPAGWSSSKASFATDYAYCLETTGFSIYSNPHNPTQEVLDCMSSKGRNGTDSGRLANGAEVIAANRSTSSSYADGFRASSTHWGYISSASTMGFGVYGKWCVGYTQ